MTQGMDENDRSGVSVGVGRRHPSLSLGDVVLQIWRAKWLMMAVAVPILLAGLLVATRLPTTYTSTTRLLATLDEFYVFRPLAGEGQPPGVTLGQEQVIRAEIELMRSQVVAERALNRFPLARIYPEIAEAAAEDPDMSAQDALRDGVAAIGQAFKVDAGAETPVIAASFQHEDPEIAAEVLNALVGAYLGYRSELLSDATSVPFGDQRQKFQNDLKALEREIESFMDALAVDDYEAERDTVRQLLARVRGDLLNVEAREEAVQARARNLEQRLAGVEEKVELYVEDSGRQRLQELQLERQDLLSRYTPDSQPVRAIDRRIARTKSFLEAGPEADGTVRRGPNPVYQDLSTRLADLKAEAASLVEQRQSLQRQFSELRVRNRALADAQPEWQALQRRRALAERGVNRFAERESDARARGELASQNADKIRVIEPARPPINGENMKMPIALLSAFFAGLAGLVAAGFRMLGRESFSTPASLEATTGLPVLAAIPRR